MSILGHFIACDGGYAGQVRTLSLHAELRLVPQSAETEKAPSHRAMCGEVECGAAWPVEGEGGVLNVKLDDPAWPEPVRARLMHGAGDEYLLVWRRPAPE